GPLYESASHGVFFGIGGESTDSSGTPPSGAGPFRVSSHASSGSQTNGRGTGVAGVTGVSVPCTERGAPIATWRSRRIAAHVSTGADPFRAGSNTHRASERCASAESDGIGSLCPRTPRIRPVGSTRAATYAVLFATGSGNVSFVGTAHA